MQVLATLLTNYYLLENPKRIKNNYPYTTLNKEEYFYLFGVLEQLVLTKCPDPPRDANGLDPASHISFSRSLEGV